MCAPIVFCVLLMAVSALGEINYEGQKEHHEQFEHIPEHQTQYLPEHYAQENLPEYHSQEHLPEHYSHKSFFGQNTQVQHNLAEKPINNNKYQTENYYKNEEHLPEYHTYKHLLQHHPQLSEHNSHKTLPDHSHEHLPEHYEQEHIPEQPLDQAEVHYKNTGYQPEHQYVQHEPAKSYQNFNLHVGPQQIIRIPVHRTGHKKHTTQHGYPRLGISGTSKSHHIA